MNANETERELLEHFRYLVESLHQKSIEAYLNVKSFYLDVHFGQFSKTFYPQFLVRVKGKISYSPVFSKNVIAFIGWRPYFQK